MSPAQDCVFCRIIARQEPGTIRYEDEAVVVIENKLRWAPVMLLVLPRRHITQQEMWREMGRIARIAADMGERVCPSGFRLISNFGPNAMQSQEHGHLHIIGGAFLGPYA